MTAAERSRAQEIVAGLSVDECLSLVCGKDFWTTAPVPGRVPSVMMTDGPHGLRKQMGDTDHVGLNDSVPSTCFPVATVLASTWDLDLEERIGEAIGQEIRAVGATLYGGVCVNVLRHPAWGRAQETYGEDPFHVGELGAALTRGVQRSAMACVKHFACNSMENARFTVDVTVDEVALHEVYLPHFKRIVDEGVAAVMSAYNAVNGEWCGQSPVLLTEVLRDEWGFEGMVISDWIFGLRDAGASVAAGLDVEMPYRMIRAAGLDDALADGSCTEDDITAAVTNTVTTLLRFADVVGAPSPGIDVLASPEHRALAREAATKSLVLLRNEVVDGGPMLPLRPGELGRVAVVGSLADVRNLGDDGRRGDLTVRTPFGTPRLGAKVELARHVLSLEPEHLRPVLLLTGRGVPPCRPVASSAW